MFASSRINHAMMTASIHRSSAACFHPSCETIDWWRLRDDMKKFRFYSELIDNGEHHVDAEEEKMFPNVCELFDDTPLEQLGQKLQAAKVKLSK
jgi:hypothetical protein